MSNTCKDVKVEPLKLESTLWDSAVESFSSMVMLPLEQAAAGDNSDDVGDKLVAGSITFTGAMEGCIVIQGDTESIASLARSMLMMEPEEQIGESDMFDALGEVVNLVIGGFKSRICETLGEIQISVPTVLSGMKMRPALGLGSKRISILAKSETCTFEFLLAYKCL